MNKKNQILLYAVLAVVAVSLALSAQAADKKKNAKEAAKDVAKTTVNYPANLVKDAVVNVGETTKNTAEVVVDTVKATGETLTGQAEKPEAMITTPITGTVETVKDAVVGAVEAPVKAGEESAEQL